MMLNRWRRALLVWLLLLVGGYGALLAYLSATQESRIFFPRQLESGQADDILRQIPGARHVWLVAADGTQLHGWWRPASQRGASGKVLLYFGGNAEDVYWRLGQGDTYPGWDLLLTDYRGYGRSQGYPGQAVLEADSLLWHDRLATGLDGLAAPQAIAVMGTSLGSYYATYLAAQRKLAAVVLATPFDSVRDYVQSRLPLLPVRLILRHPMDSRSLASAVQAPSLFIAAADDTTIPPERARLLFESWAGQPRKWVLVPQSNHDTVSAEPLYREALRSFLGSLP